MGLFPAHPVAGMPDFVRSVVPTPATVNHRASNADFEMSAQDKKETEEKLASLVASIEEMIATTEQLASEIKTLQFLS